MSKRTRDLIVVLIAAACFAYSLTVVAALMWGSTVSVATRGSLERRTAPPDGGRDLHDPTVLLMDDHHE